MPAASPQTRLTALFEEKTLIIGITTEEELRQLSDSRALICPECKSLLIYRAGKIRAPHFAHLIGTECQTAQTEPETEEHRNGKILLVQWLHKALPTAQITLEAPLQDTGQRADVLLCHESQQIAVEFQCANLSQREWKRRHQLYRNADIQDLWILGSSRLHYTHSPTENQHTLQPHELERTLFWDGAPLLFLASIGNNLTAGHLARFRPHPSAQATALTGSLSARPLLELAFPFHLLTWESRASSPAPLSPETPQKPLSTSPTEGVHDRWVWQWLQNRFQVHAGNIPSLFGIEVKGQDVFRCSPAVWQAALYYRFLHQRVGAKWWLGEVETWARGYLPLQSPLNLKKLRRTLLEYQSILVAAGFLALPQGYAQSSSQVIADLLTLPNLPSHEEILRIKHLQKSRTK